MRDIKSLLNRVFLTSSILQSYLSSTFQIHDDKNEYSFTYRYKNGYAEFYIGSENDIVNLVPRMDIGFTAVAGEDCDYCKSFNYQEY